ncbi:MAG: metallophosphoesterase [Candidatus Eisenbacteria bacterium]|nr:metallophosphoesterase [Candidatus Eisenbacteria bacterium]
MLRIAGNRVPFTPPSFTASTALLMLAGALVSGALVAPAFALPYTPIGDTLTVIMRPIQSVPTIVVRGDTFDIDCAASSSTTDWAASLSYRALSYPLTVVSSTYVSSLLRWKLRVIVPVEVPLELYDLTVTASGGISDWTENAVSVVDAFPTSFYFIQATDMHTPTHLFSSDGDPNFDTDTSETVDFREVIKDVNLINPSFLLATGDLVNEGELEDYNYYRVYTRFQRLAAELEVPVYMITGNHDVGGWDATPPPDCTARRDWWRFFGWPYLASPPPGDPARTQDYSFDFGSCHFIGMEAYINYDDCMYSIYGDDSFRSEQLTWLSNDLAAASASALQILFYHYDFSSQIDLASLGVDLCLYGHGHVDKGSLTGWPLNIETRATCDGSRAYRIVRVDGSTITPSATVSAGSSGQYLRITFGVPNDGTDTSNSATIVNGFAQTLEHAMVRFYMQAQPGIVYNVTNGTLLQAVQTDSVVVCYVDVDVPSAGSITVYVDGVVGVAETPSPSLLATSVFPNPFEAATSIKFSLAESGPVTLSVFDLQGRLVKRILTADLSTGTHRYDWDGTDADSRPVAPGLYLYQLSAAGQTVTRKALLLK